MELHHHGPGHMVGLLLNRFCGKKSFEKPWPATWVFIIFLSLITVLRFIAATTTPLTEDEAYYRLWSQFLSFGYFDHPPMVAWLIAAGRALFGDNVFADRFFFTLATSLTTVVIFNLAQDIGLGKPTAFRAAIWYNAMILIGFGGHFALPDGPASLFWILSLWTILRARTKGGLWWLGAGLCLGLDGLSKYSSFFLILGLGFWMIQRFYAFYKPRPLSGPGFFKGFWTFLTKDPVFRGLCVCGLVAWLVFSPNLLWNLGRQNIGFAKQFGRITMGDFAPVHLLRFLIVQACLFNPFIMFFAILGAWQIWRGPGHGEDHRSGLDLILATSLPFIIYLIIHALHAEVQGHWPAPLYPGFAIIAAAYFPGSTKTTLRPRAPSVVTDSKPRSRFLFFRIFLRLTGFHVIEKYSRFIIPGFGYFAAVLALLHLILPSGEMLIPLGMGGHIHGWDRFAKEISRQQLSLKAHWVGTLSFGQTALLDSRKIVSVPIVQITERDRYGFRPPLPQSLFQNTGLVFDYGRRISEADLQYCFSEVRFVEQLYRIPPPLSLSDPAKAAYRRKYLYKLFQVSGPRWDIGAKGCWQAKSLKESLMRRKSG